MDEVLFKKLENSLKQAVKITRGEIRPKTVYVVLSPQDVKDIRLGTEMSQAVFASTFNLNINTIKGLEQGKRTPDAAATNYLRMIGVNPGQVIKMLAG